MVAKNGHFNCLKYAHENGCTWNEYACSGAAANGHLDCLRYLHDNGCPWNEYTCSNAAVNGQLDCLQYAHKNGCPWNEKTCTGAALNGQLKCMQYAHVYGCPWTRTVLISNYDYINTYAVEYNCPQSFQTYVKTKTIQQTKLLAREIIAAALHPNRILQWIDDE